MLKPRRSIAATVLLALAGLPLLGGCASNGRPPAPTSAALPAAPDANRDAVPAPEQDQGFAARPAAEKKKASTARSRSEKKEPLATLPDSGADAAGFPKIALEPGAQSTLGQAFRYVGETFGGGAALTAGLEDRPVSNQGLGRSGFVAGLERLIDPYGCKTQVTPFYVFVYPEGYEEVAALSLTGKVAPRLESTRASFAIGAGTDLFNALALLSTSIQMTVVADNLVADAWCGEVFLQDAPVSAIVEALLKSARVAPGLIEVESADAFLFIRSSSNQSQSPSCLNAGELTAEQRATLASPVAFRLPDNGPELTFQSEPATLAKVLPVLTQALGVPVTATDEMGRLPVNIAVFRGISAETALDLVVRQWPLPRYGYRMDETGIHFCER